MTAPVLDLAVGCGLVLDGAEWIVEQLEPQYGTVALTRADGERMRVSVRFLVSHPQGRPSPRSAVAAADRGRQPRTLRDLSPHQRELAHLRLAHVLEADDDLTDVLIQLSECPGPTHRYGASCGRPCHPDDSSHRNDNPRPSPGTRTPRRSPADSPATAAAPSTSSEHSNLTGH